MPQNYPYDPHAPRKPKEDLLLPITMRLKARDVDTLKALGRDWLAAKLAAARKRTAKA